METHTFGYSLSVSKKTVNWDECSRQREWLTIQDRSEVLQLPQIFGADFSVWAQYFQHLGPETGEDIRVIGKHRHRKRCKTGGLQFCGSAGNLPGFYKTYCVTAG